MAGSSPIIGAVRGRGAKSNRSGRFETAVRADFDDGWTQADAAAPRLDDSLTAMKSKSIISRNDSPDIGFDQSINPYVGCSHGCIYCYARPSHAYMGLSPGVDFESRIFFKPDAAVLLEKALSKKGYQPRFIQLGANTDPYQPADQRLRISRQVIEVLGRFRHPLAITTKSALVTRDLDLLAPMAADNLAMVSMSVTTLDRRLARAMEPRASTPERRLAAIGQLSAAGVPTAVGFSPVIPGLNDHELEAVLERAAAAGATMAYYTVLRLPLEIKDLFQEWLAAERPDRAARVMSLVRQMRGGKDYDAAWGKRMRGDGPIADLIRARFLLACRRFGLNASHRRRLDLSQFRPPPSPQGQMDLFR